MTTHASLGLRRALLTSSVNSPMLKLGERKGNLKVASGICLDLEYLRRGE
jgi:hypothetical protein